MYTWVVERLAWPSSSWTTRMSAPWSSMWVAHEWRSTCGESRSPRPTRSPAVAHDHPAALAGQAAAARVQEHRVAVAPGARAAALELRAGRGAR